MERGYWIRSKPVYTSLLWHEKATSHLVVAQGQGGMAVLKLFQLMHPKQPITVLYTSQVGQVGPDYSKTLKKVVPEELHILSSEQEVLDKLDSTLQSMHMGMRLYIAGSEDFMWSVAKVANKFGIEDAGMMKELSGTLARPVYCVHCKAKTSGVTTNIGKCSGCGRMLFVRDHFSRYLGAYMGLMIDAESPGVLPEIEEIYP
jgi:ferredoxin-NADP reductase